MIKLCAVIALGCALGLSSVAGAEQLSTGKAGTSKYRLAHAQTAARAAVAPLPVERAICIVRSRRTDLCFLLHQVTGPRQCRSVVIVGRNRTRVVTSNVCLTFPKETTTSD